MGVYALKNQFAPFSVPGYTAFYALFFLTGREAAGGSPEWGFELVAHPAHEVRELAVCPLSFAAEPFRCPGAFPVQHGAKAQPFKQRLCHHSDGPAAVILALVILHTGLGHFHESGFFEDGDRPLTTALTDAGIPHDGAHINAAFTTRAKIPTDDIDNTISAYTTSVSSGCALTAARIPCKFCRTGNSLRFSGPLSSEEIALENVFMVLADTDQGPGSPVFNNLREFAYMGQGEPGFSYTQLRQAVKITDRCMDKLGQKVFRHILATCGVVEMVDALIQDLKNNFYEGTRVTFHYSLHATQQRGDVMPIENIYGHKQIIQRLPRIFELTGEKPCVGILMFKDYCNGDNPRHYSTDEAEIDRVTELLDPQVCRISLCEFNPCDNVGTNGDVTPEEAARLVEKLEKKGFQVKLFASFGRRENTACGLLGGTAPDIGQNEDSAKRYSRAVSLVKSSSPMLW